MQNKYLIFKQTLLRKYPHCEICGIQQAIEVNHALYHVHGGVFDSIENCQAVCVKCHRLHAHTHQAKIDHWRKREGEGYNMRLWNASIPETRREWWG